MKRAPRTVSARKPPAAEVTAAKLPTALARRVQREKVAARTDALARASEDIALILEKKHFIADAFYDIGEALVRLRAPASLAALACKSFRELCEGRLGIAASTAQSLVAVVTRLKRSVAVELGQEKSEAVVQIARAAAPSGPGVVDLPRIAKMLPSGTTLERASANELKHLAVHLRHSRQARDPARSTRGRTTSPAERAYATAAQRHVHARGFTTVVIVSLATRPGAPSSLRITGVPCDHAREVFRALASFRPAGES